MSERRNKGSAIREGVGVLKEENELVKTQVMILHCAQYRLPTSAPAREVVPIRQLVKGMRRPKKF